MGTNSRKQWLFISLFLVTSVIGMAIGWFYAIAMAMFSWMPASMINPNLFWRFYSYKEILSYTGVILGFLSALYLFIPTLKNGRAETTAKSFGMALLKGLLLSLANTFFLGLAMILGSMTPGIINLTLISIAYFFPAWMTISVLYWILNFTIEKF